MENKKATKTQITTLTGLAGVLLTVLANTITNINFGIFKDENLVYVLKTTLSISVIGIALCITLGMIAFAKIQNIGTGNNNDPEKLLAYSHESLVIGILAISYSIIIVITNNFYETIPWILTFMKQQRPRKTASILTRITRDRNISNIIQHYNSNNKQLL